MGSQYTVRYKLTSAPFHYEIMIHIIIVLIALNHSCTTAGHGDVLKFSVAQLEARRSTDIISI